MVEEGQLCHAAVEDGKSHAISHSGNATKPDVTLPVKEGTAKAGKNFERSAEEDGRSHAVNSGRGVDKISLATDSCIPMAIKMTEAVANFECAPERGDTTPAQVHGENHIHFAQTHNLPIGQAWITGKVIKTVEHEGAAHTVHLEIDRIIHKSAIIPLLHYARIGEPKQNYVHSQVFEVTKIGSAHTPDTDFDNGDPHASALDHTMNGMAHCPNYVGESPEIPSLLGSNFKKVAPADVDQHNEVESKLPHFTNLDRPALLPPPGRKR